MAAVAVATNTENVLLGVALVFASGTTVLVAHARGPGIRARSGRPYVAEGPCARS